LGTRAGSSTKYAEGIVSGRSTGWHQRVRRRGCRWSDGGTPWIGRQLSGGWRLPGCSSSREGSHGHHLPSVSRRRGRCAERIHGHHLTARLRRPQLSLGGGLRRRSERQWGRSTKLSTWRRCSKGKGTTMLSTRHRGAKGRCTTILSTRHRGAKRRGAKRIPVLQLRNWRWRAKLSGGAERVGSRGRPQGIMVGLVMAGDERPHRGGCGCTRSVGQLLHRWSHADHPSSHLAAGPRRSAIRTIAHTKSRRHARRRSHHQLLLLLRRWLSVHPLLRWRRAVHASAHSSLLRLLTIHASSHSTPMLYH